jgi:hypothetical protein
MMRMAALPFISLNTGWTVEYFELDPDLYEFAPDPDPVASLADWRCSERYDDRWAAMLRRTFDLEPTETCVTYRLRIERAPGRVVLFINGRRLGEVMAYPFEFDVTDYVALEQNQIALRVACAECDGYQGFFGAVYLRAIPCE